MTSAPEQDALFDRLASKNRLPAMMAAWVDIVADELCRGDSSTEPLRARRLAVRIVARWCRAHGGSSPYIPKGHALERAVRDVAMWADYDGTVTGPRGVEALARREGLTVIYVYRILAKQRELHRRENQPPLPGRE